MLQLCSILPVLPNAGGTENTVPSADSSARAVKLGTENTVPSADSSARAVKLGKENLVPSPDSSGLSKVSAVTPAVGQEDLLYVSPGLLLFLIFQVFAFPTFSVFIPSNSLLA